MDALYKLGDHETSDKILHHMLTHNIQPNSTTFNMLLARYPSPPLPPLSCFLSFPSVTPRPMKSYHDTFDSLIHFSSHTLRPLLARSGAESLKLGPKAHSLAPHSLTPSPSLPIHSLPNPYPFLPFPKLISLAGISRAKKRLRGVCRFSTLW